MAKRIRKPFQKTFQNRFKVGESPASVGCPCLFEQIDGEWRIVTNGPQYVRALAKWLGQAAEWMESNNAGTSRECSEVSTSKQP